MMKRKISEIISNINEEYICEATDYVRIKSRPLLEWIKGKFWIVGLVVLIVLGGKFLPVLLGNIFKKNQINLSYAQTKEFMKKLKVLYIDGVH